MATQDRVLQNILRKVPGRCLLYLHESTPILEAPSEASKKWVQQKAKKTLANGCERVELLKQKEGLKTTTSKPVVSMKKQPKNPNPLSCKKSKKTRVAVEKSQIQKSIDKPKRKRIKIPTHVKEILLNKN